MIAEPNTLVISPITHQPITPSRAGGLKGELFVRQLLVPDVRPDRLLILPEHRNEVPSRPELVAQKLRNLPCDSGARSQQSRESV